MGSQRLRGGRRIRHLGAPCGGGAHHRRASNSALDDGAPAL